MSDRLLSGLVHDLRGRATTFEGLGRLLEDEGPEWFLDHFTDELARMENAVELLGLLRGDPGRDPEPLSLAEALPGVLELWSHGSGQPLPVTLEHDGSAPPVLVSWPALRRALLIVLDEADTRARSADARALSLVLTERDRKAAVRVSWTEEGKREKGRELLPALSDLCQLLGGRLLVEDSSLEARFPGLGSG